MNNKISALNIFNYFNFPQTCTSLNCMVHGLGCVETNVPPAFGTPCGEKSVSIREIRRLRLEEIKLDRFRFVHGLTNWDI